jgi:membrane-associated PAP2 superfamily phosphatase
MLVDVDTEPTPPTRPAHPGHHMVYLDPKHDRPVSQYSPEGEIRMMGEFASGLSRRGAVSRPMAILLVVLILAPILISVLALLTSH